MLNKILTGTQNLDVGKMTKLFVFPTIGFFTFVLARDFLVDNRSWLHFIIDVYALLHLEGS